jgi:hypothetical protein
MAKVAAVSPPVPKREAGPSRQRAPVAEAPASAVPAPSGWSLRDIGIVATGRGGSPLPARLRPWLSTKVGAEVDGVRVHTDGRAAGVAQRHRANALTYGQHIYFGAGRYRPDSVDGVVRILHETVHAVQQRGGGPPNGETVARQEREVDAVLGGGPAGMLTRSGPVILREPTWNRRTTGHTLAREVERVLAMSRDTGSADETTRMWSNVGSNFGAVTTGSIARRVWTMLFLRHFTEPDPRGGTESVHPRYFYSSSYGWVDAQHFFGFIDFAERHLAVPRRTREQAFAAATSQGFQIERDQQRVRDYVMLQRPYSTQNPIRLMQVRPPRTPLFRAPVAVAGAATRWAADRMANRLKGTQGELVSQLGQRRRDKFFDYSARSAWTYEDPTSNQLGIRFFFQHGERINALPPARREAEFRTALDAFLSSIGVINDQAALDRRARADGLPPAERYEAPKTTEERERRDHPELYRLP